MEQEAAAAHASSGELELIKNAASQNKCKLFSVVMS